MATRVWKLSGAQKQGFRAARDQAELNTGDWMALAINTNIGQVKDELLAAGLGTAKDGSEPVKVELTDEAMEALALASEETGLPALVLARCCIERQAGMSRVSKPKRARKSTGKARTAKGSRKVGAK